MFFAVIFALSIILLLLRLAIFFTKIGFISAVIIDFLLIGGFFTRYAHRQIIPNFSSGKAIYFWDLIAFLLICSTYAILLVIISSKLPKLAYILHYIIAWIGMGLFYSIVMLIINNDLPQLLDNDTANYILHLTAVSFLALFFLRIRLLMMERITSA